MSRQCLNALYLSPLVTEEVSWPFMYFSKASVVLKSSSLLVFDLRSHGNKFSVRVHTDGDMTLLQL